MTALTASYQVQKVRAFKKRTSSSSSPVRQAEAGATSKMGLSLALSGSASQASTTPLRGRLPRPKGTSTMLPSRT